MPSCERIQKIALKTIAALALAGVGAVIVSMAVGVVSFPIGVAALLGCAAVMGLSCLLHRNIIDYSDPQTIKSLRLACAGANWATLIFTHGLPNLLKYEIITPSKCREIFQEKLNTLSFLEASALYDQLVQSIMTHSPVKENLLAVIVKGDLIDWNLKWKEEVKDLSACEIVDCYDILLLGNSGVFDSAELFFLQEVLQRLQDARAEYEGQRNELKQAFSVEIRPQQEDLEREIAHADASYLAILDSQKIVVIQGQFDREAAAILAEQNRIKGFINREIEQINVMLRSPQKAPDRQALLSELEEKRNQLIEVGRIAEETTREAWTIFNRQRQIFADEIAAADAQRNAHYERAYADFTRGRVGAADQRDRRLQAINDDFISFKQDLNGEYQRSFRL